MVSSLIIVFREVLEMALVLGVLLAATKGMASSRRWIGLGVAGGALGALIVAFFMEQLEMAFDGEGEFIFNAAVLLLASALITWTVLWMSHHGREIAEHMKSVGSSVKSGELPFTALALVSFAAVMREGSEAVFFLFGAAEAVDSDGWNFLIGGVIGALSALVIGVLLYLGLMRIPVGRMLSVAGWLLMLLAAGMASQAALNLVIIDWLPPLVDMVWDTSAWLPDESFIGELLRVLVGYDDQPNGMQLLVFVVALGLIVALQRFYQRTASPKSTLS